MAFRDKLSRLPGPAALTPEARAGAAREPTLHALREKMAEILGRSPALPRPHASALASELPFAAERCAAGELQVRRERVEPSRHVGRLPVDAALDSSAELLALLALDPRLAGVNLRRALYLDTETTGLAGAGILAFLVGLAWFDDEGRLIFEQLLLRSPAEEPALLTLLSERVARSSCIVSFNGKSFDWPLLAARAVMNRLPALPERPHLDLLHVARRLHKRRLGRCKLVDLESSVLGFERGPDIAGADIAAVYAHFLRSGDETALLRVVEHNAWDVLSMAALVGLYGEPLDLLHPTDLVGLAHTLKRAGAVDHAHDVVSKALERGAGPVGFAVRGQIAKARGDKNQALLDFEAFNACVDDPQVRLELAKLYEHHVRLPARALEFLDLGTGEALELVQRRRARLERKLRRDG